MYKTCGSGAYVLFVSIRNSTKINNMKTLFKTIVMLIFILSLSVSCKERTEEAVDSTTTVTDETYSQPSETTTTVETDSTVNDTMTPAP